jgi:hypothetical protein
MSKPFGTIGVAYGDWDELQLRTDQGENRKALDERFNPPPTVADERTMAERLDDEAAEVYTEASRILLKHAAKYLRRLEAENKALRERLTKVKP